VSERAVRAAVEVAEEAGLRFDRPVVLREGSNLLVHLQPAPVVARVATRTGAVREGDAWLSREVAVAGFLARAGLPVVAPSGELPPGPHQHDGLALTFWEHVDELPDPPDPAEAGRRLRACHEALADFDGDLPQWGALNEAERLAPPELRDAATTIRARVDRLAVPLQPIHGDAHLGNVISSTRGPLWNDWEDTFHGPLVWDLACLTISGPPFRTRDPARLAAAQRGYGNIPNPEAFTTLTAARRFQGEVWTHVFRTLGG
jgi:phosphotransferase family enzyme